MLACLQRCWVACLLAMAGVTAWTLHRMGFSWWLAAPGALLVANIHAVVLAFEFASLRVVSPGAGILRATPSALVSAWWGEVITGLRVFCWRQPFRFNAMHDLLAGHPERRGIVLVHGFVCNRGLWNPWMEELSATGTPYVAVTLEPVLGSIDRYVQTIEAAVTRLENATRKAPIIVAHSMGGLAVRAWLRASASDRRVHSIVTIATPHAGTALARFALTANTRQMREGNPWLGRLAASETRERRALFTCYFGHCDNIVFPARNATLPDADNHHVPGVAHVDMAFHQGILDDVLRRTKQ